MPGVAIAGESREPLVRYSFPCEALTLRLAPGWEIDLTHTLSNGRSSYIPFQHVVAVMAGLQGGSEGASADLTSPDGVAYEVKGYRDPGVYPRDSHDLFHTSASCTFSANNLGPQIKRHLEEADYAAALQLCWDTGYAKNDFYIYTNTLGYRPGTDISYIVVPRDVVLAGLDAQDPRKLSRRYLEQITVDEQRIAPVALLG